jgi:hypothetical protein
MAQHQAALDNYHRNTQDEDFMARYNALFDSAKELELKSLRKRAGTAGNSVPLDDCKFSCPIMDDFGATMPMLSSDRLLTAGQTLMATSISSTLDP